MILPKIRDPRFITIRRGGTLTDADHHLLALWAASCAEHVLHHFESVKPEDGRPREAIQSARAWVRGEVKMMEARAVGGHAMGAARDLRGAPRYAAYAAGQAGVVAHVAAHELGAAAYAIKAAQAAVPPGDSDAAGRQECQWQRDQLPDSIRELVLDDQRLRNDICWSVFTPITPSESQTPPDNFEKPEGSKGRWANPELEIHRAIARWAAACAERALPVFEERRPGDMRPRAAIESLRAWERGEIPMTACRAAAFAAHTAARDALKAAAPDAVAAARAAGQAAAVAHMFDHSPHAATYAAKAIGLHGVGEARRQAELSWQWDNLAPELRITVFPMGQ